MRWLAMIRWEGGIGGGRSCELGKIKNKELEYKVIPGNQTLESMKDIDAMVFSLKIADAAGTAASIATKGYVDAAYSFGTNTSGIVDAAKKAGILIAGGHSGWKLYIRIKFQRCECCWLFFTCWNSCNTDWTLYKPKNRGKVVKEMFGDAFTDLYSLEKALPEATKQLLNDFNEVY
jgi:hypothetical protein